MNRDSLVAAAAGARRTAAGTRRRRYVHGRRRRRDQDARRGARPGRARGAPRALRPEQRGRRRRAAAVQALLEAADGRSSARASRSASSPPPCSPSRAPTPRARRAACSAARTDAWIVVNDVVGAWATATGAGPGVGAISGTGSNVFGVGAGGRPWRAGGWGHLLGDEGIGYWLGVQSIHAALPIARLRARRRRYRPRRARSSAWQASRRSRALVYAKPLTKGEIAAFAVVAVRARRGRRRRRARLYAAAPAARRADRRRDRVTAGTRTAATSARVSGRPDRQRLQGRPRLRRSARPAVHEDAPARARGGRRDGACRRQPAAGRARVRKRDAIAPTISTVDRRGARAERCLARVAGRRRRPQPPAARSRASIAARSPIAPARAADAHGRGRVRERRGLRGAEPLARATKNAAANTSPAPRSSRAPHRPAARTRALSPSARSSSVGAAASVTASAGHRDARAVAALGRQQRSAARRARPR